MTEVVKNSNVVEVTNQTGYLENLEALQQRLSVCEKALAEYLETKRLTFPRFYFVSASDLLEIVSRGTQPQQVRVCCMIFLFFFFFFYRELLEKSQHGLYFYFQVTRHLLKLFDNIADLRFKDSDKNCREEDEEAVAIGMYSREGEYVSFSEPCVCKGQVI